MTEKEYLDLEGLGLYDENIKKIISKNSLADSISINTIDAIINNQLIESSDEELTIIPAKYYRIEFNEIYASNSSTMKPLSAALTELKFYDNNDNEVSVSDISVSSYYLDDIKYSASKLVDNSFSTMWSSKNVEGPHWIEFTFLEPIILSKISIAPRNGLQHGVPNILSFYASQDKTSWYKIGYYENLKNLIKLI